MDEKLLHAPRKHLGVFAHPPLAEMRRLLGANQAFLSELDFSVAGRNCRTLRADLRRQALLSSGRFSGDLAGRDSAPSGAPFIMTAHQPEFFHPGIWIKNHFVSALAARTAGVAINVVMDSDVVKRRTFPVPVAASHGVVREEVPFTRAASDVPFEEAPLDGELASRFLRRVEATIGSPEMAATFATFAECARQALPHCRTLAEFMCRSRSLFERGWQVANFELPISRLCRTEAFLAFVIWIARQREKFRVIYNDRLGEYRRAHCIRTAVHPACDLGLAGDACELPFWVVRDGRRHRLWARRERGALHLSDGAKTLAALRSDPLASLKEAVGGGLAIRPRAITNSMFLRLLAADLFVHGIGGARYDAITDRIIEDFAKVGAAPFAVLSATAFLPFELHDVTQADRREARRLIRDTFWNGERFLLEEERSSGDVRRILAEKRRLVDGMLEAEKADRRCNYERIHVINRLVSEKVARARRKLKQRLEEAERLLAENRIMSDREYPFMLYPKETLSRLYRFDFK